MINDRFLQDLGKPSERNPRNPVVTVSTNIAGAGLGLVMLALYAGHYCWFGLRTSAYATYFGHESPPGLYVSNEGDILDWYYALMFPAALLIVGAGFAIVAQNNRVAQLSMVMSVISFVIGIAYLFVDIVYYARTCNVPASGANICTDMRACCVPEFYSTSASLCPNSGACDPPLASLTLLDLNANFPFIYLVVVHSIHTLASLAIGIAGFVSMSPDNPLSQFAVNFIQSAVGAEDDSFAARYAARDALMGPMTDAPGAAPSPQQHKQQHVIGAAVRSRS